MIVQSSIWNPTNPAPVGEPLSREQALVELKEMIEAGEQSLIVLNTWEQERMAALRRMRDEVSS